MRKSFSFPGTTEYWTILGLLHAKYDDGSFAVDQHALHIQLTSSCLRCFRFQLPFHSAFIAGISIRQPGMHPADCWIKILHSPDNC
ncbi:UNVERIFIED_CONTAM: hypothetical protein PYX00_005983 [Menopon gallinae]|uniref:Uncharacterized protein n=1 Tax=Menopon gallinae TaxID=328185 RepID=A0AAW2HVD1_9NEOP